MNKINISGKVTKGFQVGSKFGIATANLSIENIPKNLKSGVYLVQVLLKIKNLKKSVVRLFINTIN